MVLAGLALSLSGGAALWAAPAEDSGPGDRTSPRDAAEHLRQLDLSRQGYVRLFASLAFGEGLRFNNPYRLSTQLGETAESLSLTAPFVEVGGAVAFGPADGLQHGAGLRFSAAVRGIAQQVITPSYLLVYRGSYRVLGYGRVGTPWILSPDSNLGGEVAAGAAFFITGGLGVCGELSGSLFYGAGTRDVQVAVYPIVSATAGVIVDYEILP